jgi:hypothetical protein
MTIFRQLRDRVTAPAVLILALSRAKLSVMRKLALQTVWCFVFISVVSGARHDSSTLYVSPSGNDANPGTINRPLKTIQRAADIARPGTTVYVRGGLYCQRLRVTSGGSQEGGFVTFRSQLGERAILDGSCLNVGEGDYALVEVINVSFVRVQKLEIRNLRTSDYQSVPWGIRVAGAGSHIEILENDVHNIEHNFLGRGRPVNGLGIGVYGTDGTKPISDLVIDGNQVHHLKTGSSESLVVNGNVSGFRITRNDVHDNNNIGIDVIGFERTAPDPMVDRARDGVVSENRVYDITSRGNLGDAPNSDGIYVDGGTRILIERNVVHDVDYGIELASEHYDGDTSHVTARNNLVYSCHASGFAIGGYDLKRGHTIDVTIINNTIYKNDTWGTGGGEFLMQFYMSRNTFKNNVVYIGDHGKLMTSRSGASEGVPTVVIDHNLYYFSRGPGALTGSFDAKAFASFAQYVKQTGNDLNSIFADPEFVDPSSGDFHLKPDTQARGKGENVGPDVVGSQDLDGYPRVQDGKIDVGCYQTRSSEA